MSNYSKPVPPEGAPLQFYPEAEIINGTGRTRVSVHDQWCASAGGDRECGTGDLHCNFIGMTWQEMEVLAWWMLEQSNISRWTQLKENTNCG